MRDNLSQRKLLEILTEEIEELKKTTENINEVGPEIARQLEKLKTTKLKVDLNTDSLQQILKEHEEVMEKNMVISKWFLILVGVVIVFLLMEVVWLLIA